MRVIRELVVTRSMNAHTRVFFFFNDTATTEIYTLSLHDALPISLVGEVGERVGPLADDAALGDDARRRDRVVQGHVDLRSEEHTSELQSRQYLVCRLLLEKKKHPYTSSPPHLLSSLSFALSPSLT